MIKQLIDAMTTSLEQHAADLRSDDSFTYYLNMHTDLYKEA